MWGEGQLLEVKKRAEDQHGSGDEIVVTLVGMAEAGDHAHLLKQFCALISRF